MDEGPSSEEERREGGVGGGDPWGIRGKVLGDLWFGDGPWALSHARAKEERRRREGRRRGGGEGGGWVRRRDVLSELILWVDDGFDCASPSRVRQGRDLLHNIVPQRLGDGPLLHKRPCSVLSDGGCAGVNGRPCAYAIVRRCTSIDRVRVRMPLDR